MSKKENHVATVNEEPADSPTTNRQINQAGPEETRNTGKRQSPSGQEQKQGQGAKERGRS
jgi:hypothetical protein